MRNDRDRIKRYKGGEKLAYKFETYIDSSGEHRFRFRAPNGEIMFVGEGYTQKQSMLDSIESIKKNVPDAEVVETEE